MRVRLKDVAAHAGVSVKTVSNVVHDYPFVSPELRERVRASLKELGYQPNVTARSLRTGRTGVIGLALPWLRDPYFAEVADEVVSAAGRHGWTVLMEQTGGDPRREAAVLAGLRPVFTDGLIFSPLALDLSTLAQAGRDKPLVLLGEHPESVARARVAIDNVTAARDAILHLVAIGRRRIAAVGAQPGRHAATAELRLAGYRAGLIEAGLRPRPSYVAAVRQFQRPDGAAAARALLKRKPRPDALFCFSDLLALGALRALHEAHVRVPDDLAVVGFDDITESRFAIPSLTTVAPNKTLLAEQAVALLARHIDDPSLDQETEVRVAHGLAIRESTAGPARSDP